MVRSSKLSRGEGAAYLDDSGGGAVTFGSVAGTAAEGTARSVKREPQRARPPQVA